MHSLIIPKYVLVKLLLSGLLGQRYLLGRNKGPFNNPALDVGGHGRKGVRVLHDKKMIGCRFSRTGRGGKTREDR